MSAITKGQVDEYSDSTKLVYFVSSLRRVDEAGLHWVCSDGNARTGITRFFNSWDDLHSETDWKIMTDTWWNNTSEDGDRRRRRMAEFMVHEFAPLEIFYAIAAHSSKVLLKIASALPSTMSAAVRPDLYI